MSEQILTKRKGTMCYHAAGKQKYPLGTSQTIKTAV